jgi:hypothetical protein
MTAAARALARRAVAAARTADRHIGRALGHATVLVEARTPMNLAVLQPVFSPLLRDSRLDVLFTGTARPDLGRALEAAGIADRFISRAAAKWMRVDLYMNADPWEAVRLRRVSRRLNFFHGVAGKYDLDCPASLPLSLGRYDRIAFPNESRMAAYVAAGLASRSQAALIGYPKVDALARDRGDAAEAARSLGLDASKPTVIFAPTFSTASVLHDAGEAIIETLLGAGCNVIAKLHDRSLDPDPRFNGGVDWSRQLHRFSANPSFLLARGGDSTPYVLASDLMVSDHSSIAFEFCVLDRPVVVFEAPRLAAEARINPQKIALLRSAAIVVHDQPALREAVGASLAHPFAGSAARSRVAEQVFYKPGSATDRALDLVYELLELAPAAAFWSAAPKRVSAEAGAGTWSTR